MSKGDPLGDYLDDPSVAIMLICGACGRSRLLAMKALVDRLIALRINPVTIGDREIATLVKERCACGVVRWETKAHFTSPRGGSYASAKKRD